MNDNLSLTKGSLSAPEALEVLVRQSAGLPANDLIISKVIEISDEIPANVNQINSSLADYLAGRFLVGINLCGELASFAVGHLLKMETQKKKEYSISFHIRAAQLGYKTVKDREQYPFRDEQYIEAENKCTEAIVFKKMVEEKKDLLEKAHYHLRRLADKDPELGYTESRVTSSPSNLLKEGNSFQQQPSSQSKVPEDEVDWDNMFK